ncbi:hypothetical protein BC332_01564 [Capsicum chinense]|nr:hypothetical protein BC332_01564 [Capsicum chinense]
MAFELTERNASYAMALMRKHFASNSAMPAFPYVKNRQKLDIKRAEVVPRRRHKFRQLIAQNRDLPIQIEKGVSGLHGLGCPSRPSPSSGHNKLGIRARFMVQGVCKITSEQTKIGHKESLGGFPKKARLLYWGTHPSTQENTMYTWINEKGDVTDRRTYKTLRSNASTIAQKLLTCNKSTIMPGDRVLLIYVPGLAFIDAFFGCLRAKVIPVPAIPPDQTQEGGKALLHIANIAKTSMLQQYCQHLNTILRSKTFL